MFAKMKEISGPVAVAMITPGPVVITVGFVADAQFFYVPKDEVFNKAKEMSRYGPVRSGQWAS